MEKWYIKTGKEIYKENHCHETSDLGEETQEENNNEPERSHTQEGWIMHHSAYNIMSDDDTESVSGYDDYYSDLDDSDSLPESVVKLFTDNTNFSEIDTDDMSSEKSNLPTLIPNHEYDSSGDEYSKEENDYDSDFVENTHPYKVREYSTQQKEKRKVEILIDS